MTISHDFQDAIHAARGAERLSPRHRVLLESPPSTVTIDETTATAEGFYSLGAGKIDPAQLGAHVLRRHDRLVAAIERAVAALRGAAVLDRDETARLASEIANLRDLPASLSTLLDLAPAASPSLGAERFQRIMTARTEAAHKNGRH